MILRTTGDLSLEQRVALVESVLKDTIHVQENKRLIAEKREEKDGEKKEYAAEWLKAHDMICLCTQLKEILDGSYDITDSEIESDITPEEKVSNGFETIISYCKKREDEHASCIGCPIRKEYGTKQPEVCKLNMIARPSHIEP